MITAWARDGRRTMKKDYVEERSKYIIEQKEDKQEREERSKIHYKVEEEKGFRKKSKNEKRKKGRKNRGEKKEWKREGKQKGRSEQDMAREAKKQLTGYKEYRRWKTTRGLKKGKEKEKVKQE